MKQAALVVRVSTAIQSYDRQVDDLKQLAKSLGYHVSDDNIYAEKISGLKSADKRLQLIRLVNDIRAGKKIDIVLTTEISRIAREPRVGKAFIEDLLELKVPVYIQNMKKSSMDVEGERDSLFFIMISILLEFAKTEAEYTKTRMKSGKIKNFKEGRNLGGEFITYGYTAGPKDDEKKAPKLIVNPIEAKVIKKIYSMYINDRAGSKVIANYLNQERIPTRTGVKWSASTISQMIKNTIYYGTRTYKNEIFEGIVPAIITKKDWDLANNIMKEASPKSDKSFKFLYLLGGGLAKCGYCGYSYSPKYKVGKHNHYRCHNAYVNKACGAKSIPIETLESLAWSVVKENMNMNYFSRTNTDLKNIEAEIKNMNIQLKGYEDDIVAKEREIKKWQRMFVMETIDETELVFESEKIKNQISNLKAKSKMVVDKLAVKNEWVANFKNAKNFRSMIETIGTDRVKIAEVIKNIVHKVIVNTYTDELCVVTLVMKDSWLPEVRLINKKTLETWNNPMAKGLIEFNDKDIMVGDLDKIVKKLQAPSAGIARSGARSYDEDVRIINRIPFTTISEKTKEIVHKIKRVRMTPKKGTYLR